MFPLMTDNVSPVGTAALTLISKSPLSSRSARELPEFSEKLEPLKKLAVPSALPQTRFWPVQSTMSLVRSAAKPAKPVIALACHWLFAVPVPRVRLKVPLVWKKDPPAQSELKRRLDVMGSEVPS